MDIGGNTYTARNDHEHISNDSVVFSVTILMNNDPLCTGTCTVRRNLTLDSEFIMCKTVSVTELSHEQLNEIAKSAVSKCRQKANCIFSKMLSKAELKSQYKKAISTFYPAYQQKAAKQWTYTYL